MSTHRIALEITDEQLDELYAALMDRFAAAEIALQHLPSQMTSTDTCCAEHRAAFETKQTRRAELLSRQARLKTLIHLLKTPGHA